MIPPSFRCLLVDRSDEQSETTQLQIVDLPSEQLPPGEVTIRVAYSSLNYKDALAAQGHRGVIKSLPHVPGIDAAGTVIDSHDPRVSVGQSVIVTGYELGQTSWGGWSELIRVPADWVVPLPEGLSLREAMLLGTAGFTAAQAVLALERNEVTPQSGEIVVTGATGGVGSLALRLLAHLGYRVVAVSGKAERFSELLELGAGRVLPREALLESSGRPLLSAKWAGAVDTTGGGLLESLIRTTCYGGCVAACGLVAGAELKLTVYPFLLRGVSLCGVASADCPYAKRTRIWDLLAGPWKLTQLEGWSTEIDLAGLPQAVVEICQGKIVGRVLVQL